MSDEADRIVLARKRDGFTFPGAAITWCRLCGAQCMISKSGVAHLKANPHLECVCFECVCAEPGQVQDVAFVPGAIREALQETVDYVRRKMEMEIGELTIEQAREILERMDPRSTGTFTPEERAAIVRVGAAYLAGEISRDTAARLLRIDPTTGKRT